MKQKGYEIKDKYEELILPNLVARLHDVGIQLSEHQLRQFSKYIREILTWNQKANLISKRDESRILGRHFLESAVLSLFDVFQKDLSVLDLGSGGGFPGVPLKIVRPDLSMTLMDSKRMKVLFLKNLIEKLELENVTVFCMRAEDAAVKPEFQKNFDIVISRAVATLPILYKWAQPFIKIHGLLIAMKGSKVLSEIQELKKYNAYLTYEIKPLPLKGTSRTKEQRVVFVYPREKLSK
ncbi:MAG: 16S rRNA (guanine(527)-N(7))-methyltransferase RsmG [bacterium]